MKTYKYLGKIASECFLKEQTIRLSQPKAFNDPFELQPEFHVTDVNFNEGEERPCKFVIHGHESFFEKYIITEPSIATQLKKLNGKEIFSQLNDQIGILCLTQADTIIPSNFLMWSHYAESHQGLVIEFKPESKYILKSRPVHYYPRRPIIDAKLLIENEYVAIDDLYFKSDVWDYENEIRITKSLSECNNIGVKDAMNNDIYVSDVPLDSIKCIYLGCNSNDELKSLAFKFNKELGINIVFLRVHDEEYKLIPYVNFGCSYSEMFRINEQLLFSREKM
ncbi:DUF2971 domain-containing protein [Pseudoalteromonas distincta]|uniref:DUF2971 domain-containing protein n=1 Tax=Pseudoalteromonas distincta TaxID=77608 RepID=UPI00186A7B32|nr:DUF2971 domain-containing protein [Pseudoalteromonas distincta]MBE3673907.1 hypothetical protein [Pseudoalteromonas distincta KMM 3548]